MAFGARESLGDPGAAPAPERNRFVPALNEGPVRERRGRRSGVPVKTNRNGARLPAPRTAFRRSRPASGSGEWASSRRRTKELARPSRSPLTGRSPALGTAMAMSVEESHPQQRSSEQPTRPTRAARRLGPCQSVPERWVVRSEECVGSERDSSAGARDASLDPHGRRRRRADGPELAIGTTPLPEPPKKPARPARKAGRAGSVRRRSRV